MCVLFAFHFIYRKQRRETQEYLRNKPWIVHACYRICCSKYLDALIVLVIVANTITLSIDYYGIPASTVSQLGIANIIFSTIFGVEMVLKLVGRCLTCYD